MILSDGLHGLFMVEKNRKLKMWKKLLFIAKK